MTREGRGGEEGEGEREKRKGEIQVGSQLSWSLQPLAHTPLCGPHDVSSCLGSTGGILSLFCLRGVVGGSLAVSQCRYW